MDVVVTLGFPPPWKMPQPLLKTWVCLTWCWTEPTQPRPVENWERRPLKLWRALQVRPQTLMTPPPPVGGSTLPWTGIRGFPPGRQRRGTTDAPSCRRCWWAPSWQDMMQIIHEWWWMNFEKYTHVIYRICFKINDILHTYSNIDNVCWWGFVPAWIIWTTIGHGTLNFLWWDCRRNWYGFPTSQNLKPLHFTYKRNGEHKSII